MEIIYALSNIDLRAIVDILLVALLFFGVSFFIRGTQAMTLLRGVLLLLGIVVVVTNVFQLTALQWLLQNILTFAAVAIPVIFQPELRRALERLGRAGFFPARQAPDNVRLKIIDDICQAAERLSERRHGALIVLERNSSLQEYMRTGVALNADVSPQLLLTIFWPKTELHDGAAIISNDGRVATAASALPLSSAHTMTTPKLGTRHRAAIGMSEVSDAVCVVVSEETGRISIANGGRLIARLDAKRLRTILNAFYGPEQTQRQSLRQRLRDWAALLATRVREQRKQA